MNIIILSRYKCKNTFDYVVYLQQKLKIETVFIHSLQHNIPTYIIKYNKCKIENYHKL